MSDQYLYEQVATQIQNQIEHGMLQPGDRLPSIRDLKTQLKVSKNTIIQAYILLENAGWIGALPQSGYYVRMKRVEAPRSLHPSSQPMPVNVSSRISRFFHSMQMPEIIPFATATLSPELLPLAQLSRLTAQMARSATGVGYDPLPGCPELRHQIARRAVELGCCFSPEEVVITIGAIEAIHLCLQAVKHRSDVVVVESPTYFGILQLLEQLGLRAIEVPLRGDTGLDLQILEEVLRCQNIAACVSVPNFSNPAGTLMPDSAKEQLVNLLEQHQVPLIESDVYGDLHFGNARPLPLKAFDRTGSVMLCSSISKTLAPGYRVGWAVPGQYFQAVEALKFVHTVATPSLQQRTIAEFFNSGGYSHYLRGLRRKLSVQVEQFSQAICTYFPLESRISQPSGGFLLWIELPLGIDTDRLQMLALEHGISIAPGSIFSAQGDFRTCLRINCGYPWSSQFDEAIQKLAKIICQDRVT